MKVKALFFLIVLLLVATVAAGGVAQQMPLPGNWHYVLSNWDFVGGVQSDGRTPVDWDSSQLAGKDGVYCEPIGEPCQFRFFNHDKLAAWIYQVVDTEPIPAGSTLTFNLGMSAKGLLPRSSFFWVTGWYQGRPVFRVVKALPARRVDNKDYLIDIPLDQPVDHLNVVIKMGLSQPKSKLFIHYAAMIATDPPESGLQRR